MRSLEERASHWFYAAWLAAALAAALACAPAFAFAEEGESTGTGGDGGAISAEATFDEVNAGVAEPVPDAPEAVALEPDGSDDPSNSGGADEAAGADDPSDGADGSQPEGPTDSAKPVEPIVLGLKTVGDRFQYVNDDGTLVKSDWKTVGGKWYYFGTDGLSVRWSQKIDGSWYYFDRACAMHTGLLTWSADGLKSCFGPDGAQLYGWQKVGGKWYYFSASSGKSVRWSQKIGGKWYYFNGASQMHTGLLTWSADGLKSCFGPDGAQLYGWQKVGGKWYYFSASSGKSVRWSQKIGGKWYYFNGASEMHTGWLKWNNKQLWSYYWDDGSRAEGTRTIAGYKYVFDANGQTATAPVTRPADEYAMERKAQSYSSSTNYMILVNRSTHKLGIFERKSGRWEMIAYWDCVTGAPSTPTITGSFKTTGGKRYSLSTDSRAKYCTQITGGYFFHTILASNNELGKSLSHGCIRLSYPAAQWIHRHIRVGTRVVIY